MRSALPRVIPFAALAWLVMLLSGCGASTPSLVLELQPASTDALAGGSATFSVAAAGSGNLQYQWFTAGAPISGANGNSYTLSSVNVSQSGSTFSVAISDGGSTITSSSATLTVTPLPSGFVIVPVSGKTFGDPSFPLSASSASSGNITYAVASGPATVTGSTVSLTGAGPVVLSASQAAAGNYAAATATVSFNVALATPALSFAPLGTKTYGDPGFPVVATSASAGAITYTIVSGPATLSGTTVTITGAGTVVVSANQTGSGNYGPATATASLVVAPETPTLAFAPVTARTFGDPAFPVSANSPSNGSISYSVVSGPATISGSTVTLTGAGTVNLSATQAATANFAAASASTSFQAGVNVALSAITPAVTTIAPGQQTFAVTASGGPTNGVTWSATGGSFTANTWTSPNAAGTFTITATSVDDPSKSVFTTATVAAPSITMQPASQSVCPGAGVTLSTAGQYAASFQWYLNGAAISGATAATYTISSANSTSSAGAYSVVASNPAGIANSSVATLSVGSTISTQPTGATVLAPAMAAFSVAAQGQPPFTYQWYSTLPGTPAAAPVPGATASTYVTPAVSLSANGTALYALITDNCGTAITSNSATLTVNSAPVIAEQPGNQTLTPGSPINLSVSVLGTPALQYQWYWVPAGLTKGIAIGGATAPAYTVHSASATASNTGDEYYVTVSNEFGTVTSQPATLQATANGSAIWVTAWGAPPENAQPGSENVGGNEQSFRSFFYPTVSGTSERIHLSNYFGSTPIMVGAGRLAAAASTNGVNGNAIDPTRDFALTFNGSPTITLQPGQEVVSDPVAISYSLGQKLAVTLYVVGTFPALTQHESQVNVNYATPAGAGNQTADATGASFTQSNTEWFLLSGMDTYGPYQGAVAVFGSSSIDGHASNYGNTFTYPVSNVPVPGQDNDRPSDWLARELAAAGYNIGVLNAGTIGDPAGEDGRSASGSVIAGVDRMQHDVLQQAGIKAVIIYFGGIDLRADCMPATSVEASLTSMVSQAYAAGVRVILATLPPSEYCQSAQPLPSAAAPFAGDVNPGPENPGSTQRRALNDWIKTAGAALPGVVAVADFDAALADPQHPDFMQPTLNSGDNFHPNGVGYGVQSSAIPLSAILGQ